MEIITQSLTLTLHGLSGSTRSPDHTHFKLMDRMWKIVKASNLKNKGLNVWVYEANEIFAGVELVNPPENTGLEVKGLTLSRYAYTKHIGSYNLIKRTGETMRSELEKNGFMTVFPYVEIYGHWNSDESKLETELLMCLQ